MTVKERLEQYIKEDKIYQDFIDSKVRIKDLTDFDLFCIQHCSDIEELLKENQKLKKQQKEFIKWLGKKQSFLRDEISELTLGMCNTDFQDIKIEVYQEILQKYKEIIGVKEC